MAPLNQFQIWLCCFSGAGFLMVFTGIGMNPKYGLYKRLLMLGCLTLMLSTWIVFKGIVFLLWNRIGPVQTILATLGFASILATAFLTAFYLLGRFEALVSPPIEWFVRMLVGLISVDENAQGSPVCDIVQPSENQSKRRTT